MGNADRVSSVAFHLNGKTIPISQGGTGGTSFATARGNLGITHNTLSNVDLNDYKGIDAAGFYYISTGVQNTPASWSWLIIIGGSGTVQIVIQTNAIYVRAYTGNPLAWTTWTKAALTSV